MSIVKKIVSRPVVTTVFVGGYVLGARAGKARYRQIRAVAAKVASRLGVGGADRATEPATDASTPAPSAPPAKKPADTTAAPADPETEHVDAGTRLAYSAGPDIEETVSELRATDPDDRV